MRPGEQGDANVDSQSTVRSNRAVLCGRCEHLNVLTRDTCEFCGGPLFVQCPVCAARNERVRTRCVRCGKRLHQPWQVALERSYTAARRMSWSRWIAILFGVLMAVTLVKWLSGATSPPF